MTPSYPATQTAQRTADSGVFYRTYTDHLGNLMALSTTGGVYVTDSRARYDPFGPFTTSPTASNPAISNHGFTGHRHNNTGDNDLGLIYMNARYYLPQVGRFVSPDTIVPNPTNPQSHNRYVYVRNNPMNFTDPTGHREIGADENDLLPFQPPPKPKSSPPSFIPSVPPFNGLPFDPANINGGSMQGFGDTTYAFEHRAGTEDPMYPILGYLHSGWDIAMPFGTSLFSLGEGTVVCVGSTCGLSPGSGGQGIGIYYDSCNCVVFYGHLSAVAAEVIVGYGITLGVEVGKSGESTNGYEHLHLEIRPSEGAKTFYNPLYFFTSSALSAITNDFMDYENGSNPWRIYGYSSSVDNKTYGSYWDRTLPALWVRY